ncbi:MAG: adenosine deaminase, partial [Rhodospirillales bacterium]
LNGICSALDRAATELGLTSHLIMCFLRHLSEKAAFDTLEQARPHRDRIIGVGLDSSELGHPPAKFRRVFAEAGRQGYRLVAHCGEEGPADYVRDGMDLLNIDRIDHGNRALDDSDLTARIARDGIALTVCPLSNLRLQVVTDMQQHPIRRMLDAGLKATVNSDDPAYFGGYMTENYLALSRALHLTRSEIDQLAQNAIEAAFLSDELRETFLLLLDRYRSSHRPD